MPLVNLSDSFVSRMKHAARNHNSSLQDTIEYYATEGSILNNDVPSFWTLIEDRTKSDTNLKAVFREEIDKIVDNIFVADNEIEAARKKR